MAEINKINDDLIQKIQKEQLEISSLKGFF